MTSTLCTITIAKTALGKKRQAKKTKNYIQRRGAAALIWYILAAGATSHKMQLAPQPFFIINSPFSEGKERKKLPVRLVAAAHATAGSGRHP